MSTAILMSGQMRTFAQCYPTQKWHVYRHYEDCHFFIVAQDNEQKHSVDLLRRDYGDDHVHAKFIDDPTDLPEIPEHYGAFAPYANAAPHKRLLLQHWYQLQAWEWFMRSKLTGQFFDFIRMRPDNWFQGFEKPAREINTVYSPWWGAFGGMNDRLAITSGFTVACFYFQLFGVIQHLLMQGCPFHPETLLLANMRENEVNVRQTLNAQFGTLRPPKDGRQEMRFPEIQAHEIAQYAKG